MATLTPYAPALHTTLLLAWLVLDGTELRVAWNAATTNPCEATVRRAREVVDTALHAAPTRSRRLFGYLVRGALDAVLANVGVAAVAEWVRHVEDDARDVLSAEDASRVSCDHYSAQAGSL